MSEHTENDLSKFDLAKEDPMLTAFYHLKDAKESAKQGCCDLAGALTWVAVECDSSPDFALYYAYIRSMKRMLKKIAGFCDAVSAQLDATEFELDELRAKK